ncbi:MAG: molybdopterin-synthase adenylyltransferase MoeB [Actinomycetes bacterium]|jgi:molybdopterin/thiamine biosynthesis adenylyltransferase/rhodanese-related sulfurtransferase|nr:MAG: molybdopterin-synthase adenylyltransferase MoeB [Actinomycetota bacterium]
MNRLDLIRLAQDVEEVEPGRFDPDSVVLVDVREPVETASGVIPGAIVIPLGQLPDRIGDHLAPDGRTVVVYCAHGHRSVFGAAILNHLGYRAVSLRGGVEAWLDRGLPWAGPGTLTGEQLQRYSRHIRLPEVGEKGQQRLLESRVLLVGAGGLGSPAALYLAAAGVGTLGIVDDDRVDASNLQRQVLHSLDRIGMPKVESARETISSLNPDVTVETHQVRLDSSNVLDLMSRYDLVVDGGDNFPTRYLVNDASLHLGVPVVHGSIFRFEGQVTVFDPYNGPCYRCVHRLPPPPGVAPSCEVAGVFGVLPGVVGSIQATEAIKLLLGIGSSLVGRLLVYDALEQEFATLHISRDPECPACRDREDPPRLVDYDDTCRPVA